MFLLEMTCFKEWFKNPSCCSGNEKLGATSFCENICGSPIENGIVFGFSF